MQILVISDIHGNLPSLEFVLKKEQRADMVISLGDVVNYGPWSNECVDRLEVLSNKVLLKGNHEDAFISGVYSGSNEIAKTFFNFCYPDFQKQTFIVNYKSEYRLNNYTFVHTINDSYVYPDTELYLNKNVFIGHSHRMFSKKINNYELINVGSVGQNRVNIDEINYALWYPELNKIELKAISFGADIFINEMISRKYPEICLNYIRSKRIS